ncbi:excinuclease ABC subunit C [Acidisoma sp. 7E03]
MGGWVYILSNRKNGTLYIGVTAHLAERVQQHRGGQTPSFTRRYALFRLVYAERHEEITAAIQREKSLKRWPRAWKIALVEGINPTWRDLYETLSGDL